MQAQSNFHSNYSFVFTVLDKSGEFSFRFAVLKTQCPDVAFRPTIPISSRDTKKILSAVTGSLKRIIPAITAPSAPMPVHTA